MGKKTTIAGKDNRQGECISNASLDRAISKALGETKAPDGPASMLLISDKADGGSKLAERLRGDGHRCHHAQSLGEARRAIASSSFDLLLLDWRLPDGDGLELLERVRSRRPNLRAIVFSEEDASPQQVVAAMRSGAVDFVTSGDDHDTLIQRIECALKQSRNDQHREQRLERLQRICRELNNARHEITGQVESLCNELMSAYEDMAEQIDDATIAAEFRTLLQQELDAEDLLRTALEYLLTKTGPTNAAVFLPDENQHYNLGAYVNYDCPRDSVSMLLDHLCAAICPQMAHEQDLVAFEDAAEFAQWVGFEASLLEESQVIAFSCRHQAECLAVIVLFRHRREPFTEQLAGTLDLLRNIFATQLSQVIKVHHRANPQWPEDAADDEIDFDDFGFDFGSGGGGVAA